MDVDGQRAAGSQFFLSSCQEILLSNLDLPMGASWAVVISDRIGVSSL
jgi:hypothetical protein